MASHLLDSIRKRLGIEEGDEEPDTFDDMHYMVGNTTGLNIGQIPGPIDQRIGRMAQIGGETLEITLSNPATFQLDRPEMMNVIDRLDFEKITLHGDPNLGFTSAYATRTRGGAGFNIVHRYFNSYLEHMASFAWQARQQDRFDVDYVNMHASTDSIPSRDEIQATDKSLDPLGVRISDVKNDEIDDVKNVENIYEDKDYLELLFEFLILGDVNESAIPQLYSGFFVNHSGKFEDDWRQVRLEEVNDKFEELDEDGEEVSDDQWKVVVNTGNLQSDIIEKIIEEDIVPQNVAGPDEIRGLFNRRNGIQTGVAGIVREAENTNGVDSEELKEELRATITDLWRSSDKYEQKQSALVNVPNHINELDITQPAAEKIEEKARKTFAGREEMYQEDEYEQADGNPQLDLIQDLFDSRALNREVDKESKVFFHMMPAWMQAQPEGSAPRFIWDYIVGTNENKTDDIDLTDFEEYTQFIDDERQNELDVIAAVGCCYIWGHFTQRKNSFDSDTFIPTREKTQEGFELPNLEKEYYTWINWLAKFDLKVNIEAMYGSPGGLLRVWRPKDIAVLCHSIDITAQKEIEDYNGETDHLVKFTIDMEHTASFGVDPWAEMEKLRDNEKKIAKAAAKNKVSLDIDEDKPLAKVVKTYHLTKPGWEQQSGHRHGPFSRGDETLYQWLYRMVEAGFARNPDDKAIVMFEVGGEYREEMFVTRVALDMIQRGIKPKDLNPEDIPLEGEYESTDQALMARFFGLDKPQFNSEMTKIEDHAFDPLDNLLEAESFDHTYSGSGYIQGGGRPGEWMSEENQ
ncbi:hypothetical protein [Candidatus Nanohalococcus occultus]|uniref:hypothetical protein n=1 Tax=Candidatus Nanohalococcus occultus TaxID=2978047 RepID=UPI0039E198EB